MEFKEAVNQIEKSKAILSQKDLAVMMVEEEKRLGVNSPEFIKRHNEIMGLIEQAKDRNSGRNSKDSKNQPVNMSREDYIKGIMEIISRTSDDWILNQIYHCAVNVTKWQRRFYHEDF